jgi:hypothetical protein
VVGANLMRWRRFQAIAANGDDDAGGANAGSANADSAPFCRFVGVARSKSTRFASQTTRQEKRARHH